MHSRITRPTRQPSRMGPPQDIHRFTSPPPSYPESISTFDPRDYYASEDAAYHPGDPVSPSSGSSRSREQRPRRLSDGSDILPAEMSAQSYENSASSQRSGGSRGGGDYSAYLNAAGLPTPPLSSSGSQTHMSIGEALRLDTGSSREPSIAPSAFEMSETDDPAVRMSLFPHPPRQMSLSSGHSSHSAHSAASPRPQYISPNDHRDQRVPYPSPVEPRPQYASSVDSRGQYPSSAEGRGQYPSSTEGRGQYPPPPENRGQYPPPAEARGQYASSAEARGRYPSSAEGRTQYLEDRTQYASPVDARGPQYAPAAEARIQYPPQGEARYYADPSPIPPARRNGTLMNGSPHLQPVPLRTAPRPPPRQQSLSPSFHIPYTCTFAHRPNGELVLEPPEGATDVTPLFVINVHPNAFIPTSYITTIRRGRAPQDLVGRFEMGISRGEPTVFMNQKLHAMKDVFMKFRKVSSRLRERWLWKHEGYILHWDCRDEKALICYHENDPEQIPLARLIPASASPPGSLREPATRIEIRSEIPQLVDEIIVSAMIVERKRLSPSEGNKNEELFN